MHKINSLVAERAIEADALTEAMVGIGMRFDGTLCNQAIDFVHRATSARC